MTWSPGDHWALDPGRLRPERLTRRSWSSGHLVVVIPEQGLQVEGCSLAVGLEEIAVGVWGDDQERPGSPASSNGERAILAHHLRSETAPRSLIECSLSICKLTIGTRREFVD